MHVKNSTTYRFRITSDEKNPEKTLRGFLKHICNTLKVLGLRPCNISPSSFGEIRNKNFVMSAEFHWNLPTINSIALAEHLGRVEQSSAIIVRNRSDTKIRLRYLKKGCAFTIILCTILLPLYKNKQVPEQNLSGNLLTRSINKIPYFMRKK